MNRAAFDGARQSSLTIIKSSKKVARLAIKQFLKVKGSGIWPKYKHWPEYKRFCLVSGAPRSGTTAMLDWLGSQREIAGFDEPRMLIAIHRFMEEVCRFKDLEKNEAHVIDMARRLAYEYYCSQRILLKQNLIVNKEPLEPIAFPDKRYKAFLENVRTLFPEAKFLFMIRDPVATVFSMRQRKWGYSLKGFEPQTFSIEEHVGNWCACADIILQYSTDPDSYICQFGRLIHDPENESGKIFDFLSLCKGKSFKPKQTKIIGFSDEEREQILERSRPQLAALHAHGISDLT